MKLYEITLHPHAGFGTPLKGDTLFGHFCWQVVYDPSLLDGGLDKQMAVYAERPFAIFSSAFPKLQNSTNSCVLKRPDMPLHLLFSMGKERKDRILQAKEYKKKKWMVIKDGLSLDLSKAEFKSDEELAGQIHPEAVRRMATTSIEEYVTTFSQPHNTINRLTQTTGTGMFAPYSKENVYYYPGTKLVVFVLVDACATDIDQVCKALERIGTWGYGRDASIGMGRFSVAESNPLPLPDSADANACYTLAPSVPDRDCFSKVYFCPFVRFGKHGDRLAKSRNPFKNPVIMADEGAVLIPKDGTLFDKPYLGTAVTGVSKVQSETMVQGYAPYLPLELER